MLYKRFNGNIMLVILAGKSPRAILLLTISKYYLKMLKLFIKYLNTVGNKNKKFK